MLSIRAVASGKKYYKKSDSQVKSFTFRELISLQLPWGQEGEGESYLFVLDEDTEFRQKVRKMTGRAQRTITYLFSHPAASLSCILSSSLPFAWALGFLLEQGIVGWLYKKQDALLQLFTGFLLFGFFFNSLHIHIYLLSLFSSLVAWFIIKKSTRIIVYYTASCKLW